MQISDFNCEDFVEAIRLFSPSYKRNIFNEVETLDKAQIGNINSCDGILNISSTQVFMNKFLINRIYSFTNNSNGEICVEFSENSFNRKQNLNATDYFSPLLRMISSNDANKGKDWLSRFSVDELYYFANKYVSPCANINIEANDGFKNHCRDIYLKDENDFIIGACCFGDYGIAYSKHFHELSRINNDKSMFPSYDLEFCNLMLSKLNATDKIEYAENFIQAHYSAFTSDNLDNKTYQEELEKGSLISESIKSYAEQVDNTNLFEEQV